MAHSSGNCAGEDGKPKLLPVSAIDYVSGYLMAFGAMVALARRASEGGSWLVRVSLARTGQWIVERGLVDEAALAGLLDDLAAADIERLSIDSVTADGRRLNHLAPVVGLSETPPRWARRGAARLSPAGLAGARLKRSTRRPSA